MGNRPKLKFDADKVAEIQQGYEKRIANQIEIINRLKDEYMRSEREARGSQLVATILLKRLGEPQVLSKAELEAVDPSEVTIVEREDGGMLVRLETKGV